MKPIDLVHKIMTNNWVILSGGIFLALLAIIGGR
jgi:hypothetical protein